MTLWAYCLQVVATRWTKVWNDLLTSSAVVKLNTLRRSMDVVNERSHQCRKTMTNGLWLLSELQALVANQEAGLVLSEILIVQENTYVEIFAWFSDFVYQGLILRNALRINIIWTQQNVALGYSLLIHH